MRWLVPTRRITAKRNEDDEDRFDVDIDGEFKFTLTEDQARRLREAIRRALASPRSPRNICRKKWAEIVRNGYKLKVYEDGKPTGPRLAHVFCDALGDVLIQFGKPLQTFGAEEFISFLQEEDRAQAVAFFKTWGQLNEHALRQA